jgi:sterol desaturase/sphingolipid hydroxylase (fatty acid hydroxylase superfamily)
MWQAACRALPSERWFVVVTASVIHACTLWGFCAFFAALEAAAACRRHKIPRRPAAVRGLDELNGRALREQVLGTCVVVPLAVWLVYPLMRWRGIVVCAPEYSGGGGGDGDGMAAGDWWRLAKDVALMIACCDTMFYWTHRACHASRFLYKHVHKQHRTCACSLSLSLSLSISSPVSLLLHTCQRSYTQPLTTPPPTDEFKGTTIWASEYFSPADMVLNILPGALPGVMLGVPFSSLMVFTVLREWQTVQSHAGYDLPWDPCNLWPFSKGARRHDFHHTHNVGMYGDWSPFWDWLCGTDRAFRAFLAREEAKELNGPGAPVPCTSSGMKE